MLVVRGAILAEWSNSGAGSGLMWKIEIGEKKDIRGGSLISRGGAIRGASRRRVFGREVCPRKKKRRYGFYSAGLCCFHTILLWFLGLLDFLLFMLMPGWEYIGFCYVLVGLELVCAWFFNLVFNLFLESYFGIHALIPLWNLIEIPFQYIPTPKRVDSRMKCGLCGFVSTHTLYALFWAILPYSCAYSWNTSFCSSLPIGSMFSKAGHQGKNERWVEESSQGDGDNYGSGVGGESDDNFTYIHFLTIHSSLYTTMHLSHSSHSLIKPTLP